LDIRSRGEDASILNGEMGRDISLLIDERELFYKNFKGRLLEVFVVFVD